MRSLGKFGPYGGMFVAELLVPALEELERGFEGCTRDPTFRAELDALLTSYAGRPTPLYLAENLSREVGRKIYLKREDLLHGGAHKTNNTIGQGLLAPGLHPLLHLGAPGMAARARGVLGHGEGGGGEREGRGGGANEEPGSDHSDLPFDMGPSSHGQGPGR